MRPITRFILALISCLLLSEPAMATDVYTYLPKGPITLKGAPGDTITQVIAITNKRPYNTSTNVALNTAGGHFSMNVASYYITLYKDSTFNLIVKYVPTAGDTSHGWLRIYDSLSVPDTVFFTGMDSTVQYNGPAWQIDSSSQFFAGDVYGRPDSAFIRVKNYSNSSVTVTSTMLLGSYGFTALGSQQRTIAVGSASNFYYRFDPKFDLAVATIVMAGAGYADTITLRGRSSTAPADEDTLTFDYVDQYFGPIAPGDTAFRTASIYNWTDSAKTITELGFIDAFGTLSLVDAPTLPHVIMPHDSLVVLMQFVAPSVPDSFILAQLYLISDPGARTQSMIIHGNSNGCVSTDPEFLWFGSVALDSTATREIYVRNHTDHTIVIDSAYLRSHYTHGFTLNTHAPLSIAPNGDTTLSISFTATSGVKDTATLVFTTSGCDIRIMGVAASIDSLLVTDTTNFELFADSTQMLLFTGDSSFATQVFSFVNDLQDSLKIMNVSLKQGLYFEIFDIDPQFPQFKMGPQDIMDVTLRFIGNPGTYDDTLVVTTETGFVALTFPIHAIVQGSSVGVPSVSEVHFSVSPNPATGPVQYLLTGAHNATVEVLDMMGKLVARVDQNGIWDHANVASGTYFMRASGVNTSGKPFVITHRIVVH